MEDKARVELLLLRRPQRGEMSAPRFLPEVAMPTTMMLHCD